MTTTVVNIKGGEPFDVYIGRATRGHWGSVWQNPYRIGYNGDRVEVLQKYAAYIKEQPELLARLGELRGKRLGCWCKPWACHGDLLASLADAAD